MSSVKSKQQGSEGNVLESRTACGDDDELGIYSLYAAGTDNLTNKSHNVEASINGSLAAMEVDTAADYSIMSKSTHTQKFSNFPLYPSNVELKTYNSEILQSVVKCSVIFCTRAMSIHCQSL